MIAMFISLSDIGPRPSRPRWEPSGWVRSHRTACGRSIQRRTLGRRFSCLARNARTGVPTRVSAWGGCAGEENQRTDVAGRRSRRSRSPAKRAHPRRREACSEQIKVGHAMTAHDTSLERLGCGVRQNGSTAKHRAVAWRQRSLAVRDTIFGTEIA